MELVVEAMELHISAVQSFAKAEEIKREAKTKAKRVFIVVNVEMILFCSILFCVVVRLILSLAISLTI